MRNPAWKSWWLVPAGVFLVIGLAVITRSFTEEVWPNLARLDDPLLRIAVALFFAGSAYFFTSLVALFVLKPSARDAVDDVDTRIDLKLRDPATHVGASILVLVAAAALLIVSGMGPGGP